jgi:hypothetical protein
MLNQLQPLTASDICFARFLKSGVYLVLEKLELQVYQRLVKKM